MYIAISRERSTITTNAPSRPTRTPYRVRNQPATASGQRRIGNPAVLNTQFEAWNRGDIPALVNTYAPDCIFVGKEVAHGRAQLLARYQKAYPTREAMGHLTFSATEIHLLDNNVATVPGTWHLERSGNGVQT